MVLKAAKAMDVLGNREARVWIHMVKAMVPERVCKIIDQAIQMHGATGVSQWTPLARMYTSHAHPAHRRRPGRGPPHGGRPQRAAYAGRGDLGRGMAELSTARVETSSCEHVSFCFVSPVCRRRSV